MEYKEFIKNKLQTKESKGFEVEELNPNLFDFQKFIVKKALSKAKYAIFADCGLGKTIMQFDLAIKNMDDAVDSLKQEVLF